MKKVIAVIAMVLAAWFVFLLLTWNVSPGQSPLPNLLALTFFVMTQIGFWVAVIAGGVLGALWLAKKLGIELPNWFDQKTPLDILKARYAKGEITREQFEQMKKD
jgi:putative membrane protein